MNKFKVGDTVKVIRDGAAGKPLGYMFKIKNIKGDWLFFEGDEAGFYSSFALASSTSDNNSPVKTKTVKYVEPGSYGKFEILHSNEDGVSIQLGYDGKFFNLKDLEESAKLFTDLVSFYKDKG